MEVRWGVNLSASALRWESESGAMLVTRFATNCEESKGITSRVRKGRMCTDLLNFYCEVVLKTVFRTATYFSTRDKMTIGFKWLAHFLSAVILI